MKGKLYLIPVPISDSDYSDYIYPALEKTINTLNTFIVEDLRTARRALRKIGFKNEFDKAVFYVLNEHSEKKEMTNFLELAEKGENIGLMSDAGMPCIADPGSEIVKIAHQKGIGVVPLYGQSSVFLALAASGLNGQHFIFHGYLPKSQPDRKKKLKEIDRLIHYSIQPSASHIFIETPYRNKHLFEDILSCCSTQTLLCIAANVASDAEKIFTRSVEDWKKSPIPELDKQPTVFLLGK